MYTISKIIKRALKLQSLLSSFLGAVRIFILTTFFRHKAERLDKKSKFETTGSMPSDAVQEEKLEVKASEDTDKFEELLSALTKMDDFKEADEEGLLQQLIDTAPYEQGMIENAYPTYILDIEEDVKWLYNVQRKTYAPVVSGAEVIPVVTEGDQAGYFCIINNEFYSVDEELITCIGWN